MRATSSVLEGGEKRTRNGSCNEHDRFSPPSTRPPQGVPVARVGVEPCGCGAEGGAAQPGAGKAPIRDATRIFLPEILNVRRAARRLSICLPETWGSLTVRFGFPVRERGSDPGTRTFDEDLCGDAELAVGEEEGVAHNLRQGAGAASRRLHRAE